MKRTHSKKVDEVPSKVSKIEIESIQPKFHMNIGKDRIITLSIPADSSGIEIMGWKPTFSGNLVPWKQRTIKMDLNQSKAFIMSTVELNDIIEAMKNSKDKFASEHHLGKLLYSAINSDFYCVNLRFKYFDSKELRYGNPGLGLKFSEFELLCSQIPKMEEILQMDKFKTCYESHDTEEHRKSCDTCNPKGLLL